MATSRFLSEIKAHQAHLEQLEEGGGTLSGPLAYAVIRDMGILKPFAVRLPAPMLAVLDELAKWGPWESKQEMVYRMIESSYEEFMRDASPAVREKFVAVMNQALDKWKKKKAAGRVAELADIKPERMKQKGKRAKK